MNQLPRLLALIGSGETAAQMTRVHRGIVKRLMAERPHTRPSDVAAAIIDSPYGFQENADALSAELADYFGRRLGLKASIASIRRADDDILSRETAFSRIREASFVFSGPGSPSYAVRQWAGSSVHNLLTQKLSSGGAIVFASAAALTLGRFTVPVYEIYKCGEDPYWLPGLDVLASVGIDAAVIPHFDNAEGGTHDTRYCYLGERRLLMLERLLPEETLILGIDEHTALVMDFDSDTASVSGRGGVTIRRRGPARVIIAGETLALNELRSGRVALSEARQQKSLAGDGKAADAALVAQRLIALEKERATGQERERLVEPLVEALLEFRQAARARGDYETGDEIRRRLVALGIEVSDSAERTRFRVKPRSR